MVVKPRDAATVVPIRTSRHSEGGIEVLMVLRHSKSKFVPGCYVYPGGRLDEDDYSSGIESFCTGIDNKKAQHLIKDAFPSEKALGAWVAGIRETFEEVGLLLAYEEDGSLISLNSEERREKFSAYRRSLYDGKIKLKDVLKEEGLTLAADRLHYFSHWITPELLPLRYDVRFFITEMPENQMVMHDGIELIKHVWISPQDALHEYEVERVDMVLPTVMTLVELSKYRTVGDVILSTYNKDIPAILTKMSRLDDRFVEIMPDGRVIICRHPEYPQEDMP